MINLSVTPAGSNFNPPTNTGDTFQRMVTLLHRGGPWAMMWDGVEHKSFYVPTTRRLHPPTPRWFEDRNCYFSVNPVDKQRPSGEATRNADVAAINAFLAEFDGKDFIREDEWLPFYADPCLEGLTPAKMRGALQKVGVFRVINEGWTGKAKFGQNEPARLRRIFVEKLRERGAPIDLLTAGEIEKSLVDAAPTD